MRFVAIRMLLKRIFCIKDYLLDPSASKGRKLLIIFGIIYLLSPVDLIPAPVLGFSIIDDVVLWGVILNYLSDELDRYVAEGGSVDAKARRRYKGMDIIEGEARVVEDDEQDPETGGAV